MKPEEIYLSDLYRIFIGQVPESFYLELIFRSAFIYLLLMISMRLMGKRMSSQISRNEMAAVASLAAAVGIPLMNPDRGLLPGLIIAGVIVMFQVAISKRSAKDQNFEAITQDSLQTLVANGVMDLEEMKRTRITRERLFAQLRTFQNTNLGAVKRLYLEANGLFSLIPERDPQPGLSLLPEDDKEFEEKMNKETGKCVCYNCGFLESQTIKNTRTLCNNCGDLKWVDAVL